MGWYLMLPPISPQSCPDPRVPLSKWEISWSFDSSDECEQAKKNTLAQYVQVVPERDRRGPCGDGKENAFVAQITLGQCVPSDDPRLQR